jgi:glycosyltransferase involved in cell wall biosynthesis
MIKLSVVLISKNQEWNIARLIESVLRETNTFSEKEIVLVDSASADQTTQIAARYPIAVLKLSPEQRLTAAAGRFVGYKRTTGDLILFLDGDMEFCRDWLDKAFDVMYSRPDVAVVTGQVIDRPQTLPTPTMNHIQEIGTNTSSVGVPHGGGAAMYRRSVLEQVGTFNPYLFADEEPALCLRIRHAGFRILRLSCPIAFHYSSPAETLPMFLGKRRRNFFLGFGQNIRYFLGSQLLLPYLRERGWSMIPVLILCIGMVAAIASGLTGQWVWFTLWGGFLIAFTMVIAIRKRSIKRALLTIFLRLLILEGTVRGIFLKPYDPSSYPGSYVEIQ